MPRQQACWDPDTDIGLFLKTPLLDELKRLKKAAMVHVSDAAALAALSPGCACMRSLFRYLLLFRVMQPKYESGRAMPAVLSCGSALHRLPPCKTCMCHARTSLHPCGEVHCSTVKPPPACMACTRAKCRARRKGAAPVWLAH